MTKLGVQSLLANQRKRAFSGEPKHFHRLLPCLRRRLHSFHFLCPLPWGQRHRVLEAGPRRLEGWEELARSEEEEAGGGGCTLCWEAALEARVVPILGLEMSFLLLGLEVSFLTFSPFLDFTEAVWHSYVHSHTQKSII